MRSPPEGVEVEMWAAFCEEFDSITEKLEVICEGMIENPQLSHVDEVYRSLHTIKGTGNALGAVNVGSVAHIFEDLLKVWRDEGRLPTCRLADLLLISIDEMRLLVSDMGREPDPELMDSLNAFAGSGGAGAAGLAKPALPPVAEKNDPKHQGPVKLQVNASEIESLFRSTEAIRQGLIVRFGKPTREMDRISKQTLDLQRRSVEKMIPRLQRVVRETAKNLDREVQFEIEGQMATADVPIIEDLSKMLPHLLRNGIDHGIESPDERREKGKNPEGYLKMTFLNGPSEFSVKVQDDGKGMDPDVIAKIAVEKGVITEEQAAELTRYEKLKLIFAAGFSTASEITEVSGRGVGMDAVNNAIESHGGRIEVDSYSGEGTTFDLILPASHSCVRETYLICKVGSFYVAFGTHLISSIIPIEEHAMPTDGVLMYESEVYPLIGFPELDPGLKDERERPALVFNAEGMNIAMCVDEIISFHTGIAQLLPENSREDFPYMNGCGEFREETYLTIDLDRVIRDWNALMIPV